MDPTQRLAYDRFGAVITENRFIKPSKHMPAFDYVYAGITQMVPYYVVTLTGLVVVSFTRKFEFGRWWRFMMVIATAVFELLLVTGSSPFPTLPMAKALLPFEQAELTRKVVLASARCLFRRNRRLRRRRSWR